MLFKPPVGGDILNELIISVISLLGTLGGSLGGILVSSKLTNYRIEQLEKRVAEHNHFAMRLPVLEEQVKTAFRYIDGLERSTNEGKN